MSYTPLTRHRPQLKPGHIQLYQFCDIGSGGLILFGLVFSPWAFGTTQPWAIWTMNVVGYTLGLLLLTKHVLRWFLQFQPPRWEACPRFGRRESGTGRGGVWITQALAVITVLLLAFCLVSAINARATFRRNELSFEYHDHIAWLPHSLDSGLTWLWFWNLLALACYFWAVRDWILGKTDAEIRPAAECASPAVLTGRLRLLVWVLVINGFVLAVEGIVQRIEGSGRLLFLVTPRVNPGAAAQFGPFAYRANAASYFNLLWPVGVGFWWTLQHQATRLRLAQHILILGAAVISACPIISTSRGGAFISVAMMVASIVLMVIFSFTPRRRHGWTRRGILVLVLVLFCGGAVGLGYLLGWKDLAPRISDYYLREGFTIREQMNHNARPMARDYPWFGTGPGTFETVFQLYRKSTDTYWPAQLHNDWLETRITFGRVGSAIIAVGLVLIFARWFAPGGIHGQRRFVFLVWLAMAGCLVHARYDFPFQIYSILLLFLTLSAILFSVSRRVAS